MRLRPFPWDSLERLGRDDVAAAHLVREWLAACVDADRARQALAVIVGGAEATLVLRDVAPANERPPGPNDLAVLLCERDAERPTVLVEVDAALAVSLVGRALKRPPPAIADPSRVAGPRLAGALGAVIAALARRACRDVPPGVRSCGPAAALRADSGASGGKWLCATFLALWGDEAFGARVCVPRAAVMAARSAPLFDPARLGAMTLEIPLVAASSAGSRAEVSALRPGDAWMPGGVTVTRGASGWSGSVLLCAPEHTVGVRATLADGRIVLANETVSLPWEDTMPENPLAESLADAPVVVRVEIGTARMPARAWARLGPGDVVTLGRRIGEHVVLRVGGDDVARGELVDVDGEIGVRIVHVP